MAKKHNFGQILTFLELLYRPPFTDESQIWCPIADLRLPEKFRLDRFIPSSCACKKPKFLPFFGLRHLVVLRIGSSLRKLNTGAQLQTFSYPTVSKSLLYYSNAFMAKSGAQSLTFTSVTNRQTNKQTKKLNVFRCPAGVKSEPHQTWHGDRGPRACSCISETFGGHRFAARRR